MLPASAPGIRTSTKRSCGVSAAGVEKERVHSDNLSGNSTREQRSGLAALRWGWPYLFPVVCSWPASSTQAISAGANVKVVRRLLGHATAAMTLDRYGHILSDCLAGVADAVSKAIAATAVSLWYDEQAKAAPVDWKTGLICERPHSPIGRGSGLKIRTVWVRVPLGAQYSYR